MPNRLTYIIEDLLLLRQYSTIDVILQSLSRQPMLNNFTDLVDIVKLCNKESNELTSLSSFKKILIQNIYNQRGDDGQNLVNQILGVK